MSSPVTIFPTVRRAGMRTEGDGCLKNVIEVQTSDVQQNRNHKSQNLVQRSIVWKESTTHSNSSTSRGHTPASITAWILSFVPSERYESAQHASVKTSSSLEWIRRARAGSAGLTCWTRCNKNTMVFKNKQQKMWQTTKIIHREVREPRPVLRTISHYYWKLNCTSIVNQP